MNSLGDCPVAKEWKELMTEEILMEKKKELQAKKRAAEAEENKERKKQINDQLSMEFSFEEDKENASAAFSSLSTESATQQKVFNVCTAGDYCVVSNGHKVACTQTCRICDKSCHFNCCESDEYNFKTCNSCGKDRAISEDEEEFEKTQV